MTDLPEPLTPPECDLRGLEWMPLYGDRLFTSETWLLASPEGRVAALALWWAAWKQTPAGSLADNDRFLAQLAGYGMAVQAWQAVRGEALRGWVLCSDGRLYHPLVCELALEAWDRRQEALRAREAHAEKMRRWREAKAEKEEAARAARAAKGSGVGDGHGDGMRDGHIPARDGHGDGHVTSLTGQDRTGQEIQIQESTTPAPLSTEAAPTGARGVADDPAITTGLTVGGGEEPAPSVPTIRQAVWQHGIPILRNLTGKSESACRTFLGKLLREAQDDCARVYAALREAESLSPADPGAWLMAAVRGNGPLTPRRGHPSRHDNIRWMMDMMPGAPADDASNRFDIDGTAEEMPH